LHARFPNAGGGHPREGPRYRRHRAARGAVLQSVPLHRLPEHPEICAGRGRRNAEMAQIGRSVKRIEDRPLLTGAGQFVADLAVADMLHMRVVRSAVAFGCLTSISTEAARAE